MSSDPRVGLMPAPEGETPDFDGLSSLQVTILTVYISTSVLATVGLCLRMYTGARLIGQLGLDAVFLIAAWATYLASFIGMVKVMPCGFGKHLWSVTEDGLECYKNMLLFLGISYFWPPTLAKLSLIVLYHRINPSKPYRQALYLVAFVILTYTLVFTLILAVPCNPLAPGTTECLNNCALAQAILNISSDGALIIMPIITVWGLQLPSKQKIAVGIILALGSAAVIASCVRIAYVRAMLNNPDVLYTQGSAAVWSAVEINIGILCNCLAMLKPFVRRHLPWLRSLVGRSTGADNDHHSSSRGLRGLGPSSGRRRRRGGSGGGYLKSLSSAGGGNKKRRTMVLTGESGVHTGVTGYEMYGYEQQDTVVTAGRGGSEDAESQGAHRKEEMDRPGILVTTTVAMGRNSEGDASTDDILRGGREQVNVGCAV